MTTLITCFAAVILTLLVSYFIWHGALKEIRSTHEKDLAKQAEALKNEMTVQTEQLLKQREQELARQAESSYKQLTDAVAKDLREMKSAFEESKKSSQESNVAFRERFDNAVRSLEAQTKSIGSKADNLADAMRGQKKMQGCWGETILYRLLCDEGLVEGTHFEREETLRDENGIVILNEDTDKRMRPDYIIHFFDGQDLIVDSKVSLSAFADWSEATEPAAREEAAKKNLQAIRTQIERLSNKDYSKYLKSGNRMADYVVMFIPNFAALDLARQSCPTIWRDAYAKKVVIATSETIMPMLRMISAAWRNVEQVKNQERIIAAASKMLDRVADLVKYMNVVDQKLTDARTAFDSANAKLKDSGQSIVVSANQLVKLGVTSKKALPEAGEDI
ncbi:MAG: DNA recombination protein RmuC [Bacteroidales bacterium]|nr:DNA recombination protein RmuC [Bacteroidales bacterium]